VGSEDCVVDSCGTREGQVEILGLVDSQSGTKIQGKISGAGLVIQEVPLDFPVVPLESEGAREIAVLVKPYCFQVWCRSQHVEDSPLGTEVAKGQNVGLVGVEEKVGIDRVRSGVAEGDKEEDYHMIICIFVLFRFTKFLSSNYMIIVFDVICLLITDQDYQGIIKKISL
jgi:hypothetical protein